MSNSTTEEIRNENYTVNVIREPGCKIIFSISIVPKTSTEIYRKAIKSINKEVMMPGFRKGKAPEDFVVNKYGSHVEREWREQLLETAFHEAMKLTNLHPLNKDSIRSAKINNISRTEDSVVIVEFESLPAVPEVSVEGIVIEELVPEPVKEEKINQIIEDLRYQFAEWSQVSDRAVEEGDFVDLDIVSVDNPEELDLKDTRVEVVKGKVGQWLHDLLIGMNSGESREGISAQEPGKETPEFRPTNVRITLNSIQKSALPPVDNELAKKAGAESLEAMKERIARDVGKAHEKQAHDKRRQNLIDILIVKYSFDIPASLVSKTAHRMINNRIARLREMGDESLLTAQALEEMEAKINEEVKKYYQWQFITQQIAERENLQLLQNEIINEMMQRHYLDPNGPGIGDKTMDDLFTEVATHLMAMKAADFLLEKLEHKNS